MRLVGKKIALVIAPQQFRDEELFIPRDLLAREGAELLVASCKTGQCRGSEGGMATAMTLWQQLRVESLHALLLVGGRGARQHLWGDRSLAEKVARACQHGTLLGAICVAPVVFAETGLLRGRRATCWPDPDVQDALLRGGADLCGEAVVTDGPIVTAAGPRFAEPWAEAVRRRLLSP